MHCFTYMPDDINYWHFAVFSLLVDFSCLVRNQWPQVVQVDSRCPGWLRKYRKMIIHALDRQNSLLFLSVSDQVALYQSNLLVKMAERRIKDLEEPALTVVMSVLILLLILSQKHNLSSTVIKAVTVHITQSRGWELLVVIYDFSFSNEFYSVWNISESVIVKY